MPFVASIKQTFGLKSVLNAATFVATFTVLASGNMPVLRAVAAASTSTNAYEHAQSVAFEIPAAYPVLPGDISLPPVPAPFDAELILQEPQVTFAAIAQPATSEPRLAKPNTSRPQAAMPFGLFGSLEFRTNATKGTGAWRKALARLDNEQPLYEFCDIGMLSCPPKYVAWRQLLAAIRHLPAREQLVRLNRGINAMISHGDDAEVFRVRDHWAAPMEFLQTGGDCEDYTILKYASLLELGYSDHDLRIAVVKDTTRQQDHAVLAVAGRQGVTILDSLTDAPLSHERINHYKPLYSVNRADRWVHIATKQISRLSVASISN